MWIPFSRVELKSIPQTVSNNNNYALLLNKSNLFNATFFSNTSEISLKFKCTLTCASKPLSALFYVALVYSLAVIASYYTYRIRHFHKYFRQTCAFLTLLLYLAICRAAAST